VSTVPPTPDPGSDSDPNLGSGSDPNPGSGSRERPVRDAVRLAVGTLTAFPVRPPERIDASRAGLAMALAPVAGLIPGLGAGLVAVLSTGTGLSLPVAAVLTIGSAALLTRGMHLDGLADTADGFAASYQRERALAVMRSGDSGPAGVTVLVLVLLLQVTALAQAMETFGPVAAVIGVAAGRTALPVLCMRGVPAARPDGLGAAVAGTVSRLRLAAVLITSAGASAALLGTMPALWDPDPSGPAVTWLTAIGHVITGASAAGAGGAGAATAGVAAAGMPMVWAAVAGAAAVAASTAVAAVLAARALSRFGGITGDVLGAAVESGTAAALLILAAAPR
jgi:adenosylcobinamide-GDP ribazoletransferase